MVEDQSTTETGRTTLAESFTPEIEQVEPGLPAVQLPEDAPAFNETVLWTGAELILWGGQADSTPEEPAGESGCPMRPSLARSPWPFGPTG